MKKIKINRYTVSTSLMPEELNGKRAILISDLHDAKLGQDNYKLINLIKNEKPDFILIAGDVVTCKQGTDLEYIFKLLENLSKLGVSVYYAPGNHEHKLEEMLEENDDGLFRQRLQKYCTYLTNSSATLVINGKTIEPVRIYGLDLPIRCYRPSNKRLSIPDSPLLTEAGPKFEKDKYTILIAHDPQYFEAYTKTGASLVVSGHLHGGMIRLPLIGGLVSPRYTLFPKYDLGSYKKENTEMIVTSGIGWHHIPLRLFNPPEIVAITFSDSERNKQ